MPNGWDWCNEYRNIIYGTALCGLALPLGDFGVHLFTLLVTSLTSALGFVRVRCVFVYLNIRVLELLIF
jgi:hypothetical protein